jgi:Mrp family chromosome partitioning ATPase
MGKILETLKQGTAQPEASTAQGEGEAAVPFIEVGSRRGPVEASPDVLANMRRAPEAPVASPLGGGPHFRPLAAPSAAGPTLLFRPLGGPTLPEARLAAALVAYHQPGSSAARQYEALADSLLAQLATGTPQVLLFTPAAPAVEPTTALLNLAVTFARRGDFRVAAVDGRRQRPTVAGLLGLAESPGLQEVLSGRASLAHALRATAQRNLFGLPAGQERRAGAELRSVEALRALFGELRQRCDLILIDAPAWGERPEAAALAGVADAVYLVSSAAEPAIRPDLLQSLSRQGVPLRGQLFTDS